jgi:hypothetical protein
VIAPPAAATAAAPQMEKPQAISTACVAGRCRARPMSRPLTMPMPTIATITTMVSGPSAITSPIASCRPSSTIPMRSTGFAARSSPGFSTGGSRPRFAARAPTMIAASAGEATGTSRPRP